MSPGPYPARDFLGLLSKRNLTTIPKDQQALLASPGSWAVDLENTPIDHVNVPRHVCVATEEAYIASTSATQEPQLQAQQSPIESTSLNGSSAVSNKSPSHNGVLHAHTQNGDIESPPPSPPEEPIPWSPSPERPQPPRMVPESSIVKETPKAPMGPPPLPAMILNFPSSDGPEDDLEMELPQAQDRQDAPINRAAAPLQATLDSPILPGNRTMGTPPCAQPTHPTPPVIPNTVIANNPNLPSPHHAHPLERRRERRMKAIYFNDTTPKKNHHMKNRLAPTTMFSRVPSSGSTSPSSIIPATFDEPRTPGLILQSVENAKDVDMDEPDEASESNGHESDADVIIEESQVQIPVTSSNQYLQTQENQPPLPRILDGDLEPYSIFKMAYPEYEDYYSGALWEFVKSCVILDYLRKSRMLRECMYDDFIRAFPTYQAYVRNAGAGQEALPAIEWFNILPGAPVFTRTVVTKDNIGYILDLYPKEVANASQLISENSDEEIIEAQEIAVDLGEVSGQETIEVPARMDLQNSSEMEAVGELPGTVNLDNAMALDLEGPQRQPSSTPPLTSVSRRQKVLTQAPPPPSPILSSPAAITTLATRRRPPRASQYLAKLAASSTPNAVPRRRTIEERAKLREHFLRRKSVDARSTRSSSKPGGY